MKTPLKPVIVLLLFAVSFSASAQKGNVLKLNILSPIIKTFNIQYERKVSADASFQLGFFYTGYSDAGEEISGFGVTPEYRFYLSETEAPNGVFVAPFIRYQNFTLTEGTNEGKATAFGGGLIIGKQWIFKEKVALDIFLGPSYLSGSSEATQGTNTFDTASYSGFGLRAGICFGIAF